MGAEPLQLLAGGEFEMYLSPRNSRNRCLLRSKKWHLLSTDKMSQLTNHNVGQSNLIYICSYLPSAQEPGGAVGAACPQLWGPVCGAPKLSARTEQLLLVIFCFVFYRLKGQRVKHKWPKTDEKTRFGGNLDFSNVN